MYAIVKDLVTLPNGGGVVLNVDWFEDDPSLDRDMTPWRVDQILLPVPTADRVTDADIDEALDRREAEILAEHEARAIRPGGQVRARIGKVRPGFAERVPGASKPGGR